MRQKHESEAGIVARQSRRWELDRALMQRTQQDEERSLASSPVITISREMGAGGVTTGQIVANELQFAYYDKEIIKQIADLTGSSAKHIAHHDEHRHDVFANMMLGLLDARNVPDTVYIRALYRVLKEIAKQGKAVIVGRGAGCVLPEAIKVRLVAPFELRVQRMAMVRGISEKEAEPVVLESDHAKKRFLRHFFGCNPSENQLYDLVINTGTLSLDHAAELIIARVRQTWKEA